MFVSRLRFVSKCGADPAIERTSPLLGFVHPPPSFAKCGQVPRPRRRRPTSRRRAALPKRFVIRTWACACAPPPLTRCVCETVIIKLPSIVHRKPLVAEAQPASARNPTQPLPTRNNHSPLPSLRATRTRARSRSRARCAPTSRARLPRRRTSASSTTRSPSARAWSRRRCSSPSSDRRASGKARSSR